jgi:hypothetical protein
MRHHASLRHCFLATVDGSPALDVLELHHQGGLTHGAETVWEWPGPTSVRVRTDYGRLLVTVDGGPEMVVQHGAQARPEGDRPHFYCPVCDRVVLRLYLTNDRLQCRHCADLVYAVQYGRRWCPALQRVYKLRARLGADLAPFGPLPPRPWDWSFYPLV